MYQAPGIGLAAIQVGIDRSLLIYDISPQDGDRSLQVLLDLSENDRIKRTVAEIRDRVLATGERLSVQLVAAAAAENDPEVAELLRSIRRIRVMSGVPGNDWPHMRDRFETVARDLENRGWNRIVRVREDDELVLVLVMPAGDRFAPWSTSAIRTWASRGCSN